MRLQRDNFELCVMIAGMGRRIYYVFDGETYYQITKSQYGLFESDNRYIYFGKREIGGKICLGFYCKDNTEGSEHIFIIDIPVKEN